MPEEKYKNKYRIPSTRAAWHDYLDGAYFVTICTKNRERYFGDIKNEQLFLSEIGKYADEQFRDVSTYYPYASIPSYIVMPNHIHAIVIIDNQYVYRNANDRVSEPNAAFPNNQHGGITGRQNPMLYHCLGKVIRGLKARITHYANENNIDFVWQSRFHDRIIRDQKDMNETAKYVADNIVKWPDDDLNS